LVLEQVARLHEGFRDFFGDLLGGDRAVGAVDLCEALAAEVGAAGLIRVVSDFDHCSEEVRFEAYVCGSEFLVSAEDGTAALSGVESTLALDGGLAVGARSTDGLADLGDLVPVAHCEGVVWCGFVGGGFRDCWLWGCLVWSGAAVVCVI
jgi:hypothetical protein